MNSADSVYDHTKGRNIVGKENEQADLGIRYDYMGPFANTMEALTSQALAVVTMPREDVQRVVRPRIPNQTLLPPRFGYRTRAISLMDVINVNHDQPPTRVDFTGGQAGYQGTERNAQSGGFW